MIGLPSGMPYCLLHSLLINFHVDNVFLLYENGGSSCSDHFNSFNYPIP